MRNKIVIAGVIAIAALSGCSNTYTVKSEPEGANVRIDGQYIGVTPAKHTSKCTTFGGRPRIELSNKGYRTQQATMEYEISALRVVAEALLFWPLLLVNAECPMDNYFYKMDKQ